MRSWASALSACHVPGTMPGIGDTAVTKIDNPSRSRRSRGKQTINKQVKQGMSNDVMHNRKEKQRRG